MTQSQVLRALCRFDSATTEDIAMAFSCSRNRAGRHLAALVKAGYAVALGKNYIRYSATETGRKATDTGRKQFIEEISE